MVSTDGTPLNGRDSNNEPKSDSAEEQPESSRGDRHSAEAMGAAPGSDQDSDREDIGGDDRETSQQTETEGEQPTSSAIVRTEPQRMEKKEKRSKLSRIERTVMEFQPDVVELEHRKVPGGARWVLYVAAALIVGVITWAYWAEVDRVVVAQGELIPTEKPVLIQPLQPSTIVELHVSFNDIVRPGDLLVTLDPTYSQADLDQLSKRKTALEARIARLEAEIAGVDFDISEHADQSDWQFEQIMFEERRAQMLAERARFAAERGELLSEQESNEEIIKARTKLVRMFEKQLETDERLLQRQSISEREQQNTERQKIDAELQLTLNKVRRDEFQHRLKSNETQEAAFFADRRATTADLLGTSRLELSDVSEELRKARRSLDLAELRVPEAYGDVEFIVLQQAPLSRGSVVSPGDAIYRLMPLNTELEVEIKIDGKDVARVRPRGSGLDDGTLFEGDVVRIKLAAFPYQRYGTLEGRMRAISEGTLPDEEGGGQRMIYQGRVELVDIELNDVPDDFRLLPGMQCVAEIKIGHRKVLHYFLYPVWRLWDSSLREP